MAETSSVPEKRCRAPHVTITRRPGSRFFQIQYYWQGRQYRRTTRITSKDDAKALQRDLQLRLSSAYHLGDSTFRPPHSASGGHQELPHEAVTVGAVFDLYREELKHLSPRHRTVQGRRLDALEKRFGRTSPARSVTTAKVQEFIEDRRREGASDTTIHNDLVALSRAYHLAIAGEDPSIAKIPYRLSNPPRPARFSDRVMPAEKAAEVLGKLDASLPVDRAILLALNLGLRSGDLVGLKWEDVDLEAGTVTLKTQKTKTPVTNPLPSDAVEALKPHAKTSGLVCPVRNPSTEVPKRVEALCGERWGLHSMRKAYASALANSGANLAVVASMMAHRQVSTTAGYISPNESAKRVAVDSIGYLNPRKVQRKAGTP